MILFEEALRMVSEHARRLPAERVGLGEALGRIAAEDVTADLDLPPFDKSAMDGYACRRRDRHNVLRVVDAIPAGRLPARAIGENECAKIMTGAAVPAGADCVIMLEHTEPCGRDAIRITADQTQTNICAKGEDLRRGEVVVRRGERVLDRHVAVLASVGCTQPAVSRRARVGLLATGDELVEPSCWPGPAQIRNSNACQLQAQLAGMGATSVYYGIAADNEAALSERIRKAAAENDAIVVSGGVSAGDHDLVPPVLRAAGFELLFEKVATQPGMPTVFGRSGRCFCFGLPGNPVATFIVFETLVKPFLFKLMGHAYQPRLLSLRLGRAVRRRKTDRAAWIPVAVGADGVALPVEYHGSAHANALCAADGLICVPIGVAAIQEGASVAVRQI